MKWNGHNRMKKIENEKNRIESRIKQNKIFREQK